MEFKDRPSLDAPSTAAVRRRPMATRSSDKPSKKPATAAKKAADAGGAKRAAKPKAAADAEPVKKAVAKPAKGGTPKPAPAGKAKATKATVEPAPVEVAAPLVLTDEEKALAEMYGDELGAPAAAHGEFKDQRTADEDRQLMPEITARDERNKRWEGRREERSNGRRRRRDRSDRPGREPGGAPSAGGAPQGGGGNGPAHAPRPHDRDRDRDRDRGGDRGPRPQPSPAPVAATPLLLQPPVADGTGFRVGTVAGDGAAAVFASLRGMQPMPVKQLGAMMRKRGLFDADPEQAWPGLKSALLADERSYRALGLRPRIVYRGRDLFAPGAVVQSASGAAEGALACALSGVHASTRAALKTRVTQAGPAGFERIVDAYLTAAGYRELTWVKRHEGIGYATALPPHGERPIMISARGGDMPVDRRGVGELRVGVEAKALHYGLLIAARELSEEAERELEKAGRSIQALVGDALVDALVTAGVGVVTAAAPLAYVDDQLLDELLAG